MKLSDETILHMVKLLQVAVLSGTDIVDHFRNMNLHVDEDTLQITEESVAVLDKTIQEMLTSIPGQESEG